MVTHDTKMNNKEYAKFLFDIHVVVFTRASSVTCVCIKSLVFAPYFACPLTCIRIHKVFNCFN